MNLEHRRPAYLRTLVAALPNIWHVQGRPRPETLPGAGGTSQSMALAVCCRELGFRHQFTRFDWPQMSP